MELRTVSTRKARSEHIVSYIVVALLWSLFLGLLLVQKCGCKGRMAYICSVCSTAARGQARKTSTASPNLGSEHRSPAFVAYITHEPTSVEQATRFLAKISGREYFDGRSRRSRCDAVHSKNTFCECTVVSQDDRLFDEAMKCGIALPHPQNALVAHGLYKSFPSSIFFFP
jgi:hypothetical protein